MIVYFRDQEGVEFDVDPEVLWCMWKLAMAGQISCRLHFKRRTYVYGLDILFLAPERTFGEAILKGYPSKIPPDAA